MKDRFPEFYEPAANDADADASASEFVTTATIAFDASALLELYRFDADERLQILAAIGSIGDRLFVPHHAALEYHRGRSGAIDDQRKLIDAIVTDFGKAQKEAAKKFADKTVNARVRAAWETASGDLAALTETLHTEYALTADDDDVRDALDRLLTPDRLGAEPSAAQVHTRCAEFDVRARMQVPPGYLDAGKGAPKMYGDYLIWCELLDKARESELPMLLVTNDDKKDWSDKGSPRRELVHEMRSEAGTTYHHIHLRTFLRHAKEHLSVDIDDATIDSVGEGDSSPLTRMSLTERIAFSNSFNVWADAQRINAALISDFASSEGWLNTSNQVATQMANIANRSDAWLNTRNQVAAQMAAIAYGLNTIDRPWREAITEESDSDPDASPPGSGAAPDD